MELGTLPEWFTACAEVLAVCTALFLPQYTAYRNRKASYDRMLRVTSGLLRDLADDLERCCGSDALQLESAKELQLYLRVSFYALSEAREIALRAEVERLYRRLVAPHADLPALRKEIAEIEGGGGR